MPHMSRDHGVSGVTVRRWLEAFVSVLLASTISALAAHGCSAQQRAAVVEAATECRVVDLPPPICVSPVDAVLVLAELVDADRSDRDARIVVRGPDGEREIVVPRAAVRVAADAVRGAL